VSRDRKRILHVIGLVLGLLLFVGLLVSTDLGLVWQAVRGSGPSFLAALVCYFTTQVLTALAWRQVLTGGDTVPFRRLIEANWAGHAINQLTPGATAGEIMKASLLDLPGCDRRGIWSSVITLNLLGILIGLGWVAIASTVSVLAMGLDASITTAICVASAVIAVVAAGLAWLLAHGVTGTAVSLLCRLPGFKAKRDAWIVTADGIDQHYHVLRSERKGAMLLAVICLLGVRILQVVEVYMLTRPLLPGADGADLIWTALFVQAAGQVVSWIMVVVPGQIGVAEAGSAASFVLIGLDPVVGLTMELLRRARKVIGIAIGLVIAAFTARSSSRTRQRDAEEASTHAANEPRL